MKKEHPTFSLSPKKSQNQIWRCLKERDLSQKVTAYLLGQKKANQVSAWQRGESEPTLRNGLQLAIICDKPVEEVFAGLVAQLRQEVKARAAEYPGLAARLPHLYDDTNQSQS